MTEMGNRRVRIFNLKGFIEELLGGCGEIRRDSGDGGDCFCCLFVNKDIKVV